jgi:squalene-associated FAD-dependent desaturase
LADVGVRVNVAVIGAGWAGLAAAAELTRHGTAVTVFETASNLGGRARGFQHKHTTLDNGQHILLGAYHETLRLMRLVGVDINTALLRLPLTLDIPDQFRLKTPLLPAPLHLLAGLLTAKGLGITDRLITLRFIAALRLKKLRLVQDQTVATLLANQPKQAVKWLWEPLCVAALNTPIHTASAQVFLNVLRDSFSRARSDSDLLLPRTDLSSLFPQAAAQFITRHGGTIHTGTTVNSLRLLQHGAEVNGERFSHVICAVAPHQLNTLLQTIPEAAATLSLVNHFTYQPIATVYLQYPPGTRLPFPMLGLSDGYAQWVFDRGTLGGQHGLLAASISAEGFYQHLPHEQLAAHVHAQLQAVVPGLPAPKWQQVIVEKRATFACTAGLQRPPYTTAHPRLFVAGDYTAGDYPATLEGAVRSGVKCAQLLLVAPS